VLTLLGRVAACSDGRVASAGCAGGVNTDLDVGGPVVAGVHADRSHPEGLGERQDLDHGALYPPRRRLGPHSWLSA
jgi:hypothetical protein